MGGACSCFLALLGEVPNTMPTQGGVRSLSAFMSAETQLTDNCVQFH